jgi:endoglucanase
LRDKGDYAISKGLALFITEWGTTNADGGNKDRKIYTEASELWLKWAEKYQISWANWALMNKNETSSALVMGASTKGDWPEDAITQSGRWVKEQIKRVSGVKSR